MDGDPTQAHFEEAVLRDVGMVHHGLEVEADGFIEGQTRVVPVIEGGFQTIREDRPDKAAADDAIFFADMQPAEVEGRTIEVAHLEAEALELEPSHVGRDLEAQLVVPAGQELDPGLAIVVDGEGHPDLEGRLGGRGRRSVITLRLLGGGGDAEVEIDLQARLPRAGSEEGQKQRPQDEGTHERSPFF